MNQSVSLQSLASFDPKLFLVAGHSQIIKSPFLQISELGTLNLHTGKLHQYRGGSPQNWQLINGDNEAGLSGLKMNVGIDSGEVLSQINFPIEENYTFYDLNKKANQLFPESVLEVLQNYDAGRLRGELQTEVNACY